ncbi:hypothetical protein CHS0354_014549 [Potamilus streckersoni]|uniref:Uncharacterized protein n=1 Tax=Potamilus streckersoni TaxID=2493646 RepID=A0AAE0VIA0_9BIVA|nr:hypothetical protein CHS0354_014549 [Potamilus streckersoni]
MDAEQFICSLFSLPNKCYPRFNKLHKQLISTGQRFQVTVEKFHRLTQTKDCVPLRLRRNEWMAQSVKSSDTEGKPESMQCNDTKGKPVANVYIELVLNIQRNIESLGLLSFDNLQLLFGMDPSIQRDASSIISFETALMNVFQNQEKFHAVFKSATLEDFISSEGDVPKMIQLHLDTMVVQPLQDMLKLVESNTHTYRKNSEETFKGLFAIKESMKERIECVEGVAMVCGELQVHVSAFSSVQKEKEVLKQIDEVIKKFQCWQNYSFGVIEKKPIQFYSVGSNLHCPALNRCGTLGGFAIDMDENLYILTCAHVVPSNADVQVEIGGQTIGRSVCVKDPEEIQVPEEMQVPTVTRFQQRCRFQQRSTYQLTVLISWL